MEEPKTSGLKEVTREIVGWDDKIFRTLKHLTTQPGEVVAEYCKGEKQNYLSPVVYFFGVTALETFVATYAGLFDFMLQKNLADMKQSPVFAKDSIVQISENLSFFFSETGQKIILVPLLLLLTWLFYKKYNASFKENSWFALYILGHATLLSIPFIAWWYFTGDLILYSIVTIVMAIGYWVWASLKFYNLTLGKAILIRVLMFITAMVTLNIGMIVMIMIVTRNST